MTSKWQKSKEISKQVLIFKEMIPPQIWLSLRLKSRESGV